MAANSHRDIRKEGEEQQAKTMKDVAKFDRLSRWTISHLSGLANCQYRLLRTTTPQPHRGATGRYDDRLPRGPFVVGTSTTISWFTLFWGTFCLLPRLEAEHCRLMRRGRKVVGVAQCGHAKIEGLFRSGHRHAHGVYCGWARGKRSWVRR